MRILLRSELYLPSVGGVQTHVQVLAEGLARRGHEVHLLTSLQQASQQYKEVVEGVHIVRTPGFGSNNAGLVSGVVAGLPAFWRMAPNFDIWHTHVLFAAVPAMLTRRFRVRKPHVITVHTSRFLRLAARPIWRIPIRMLLGCADHALATSQELADVARRMHPRVPVTAIVNAVDTNRFRATMPLLRSNRPGAVVVCPRRLVKKNGVDVLLAAWPLVVEQVEATLFICGIGEESEALKKQRGQMKHKDSVRFHGKVEHNLMPAALSSADLVVIPSRVEATSLSALEAMACERPLVSTNVGGLPEVVDDKVGRLVPSQDPQAMAAAIIEMLRMSKEERQALGATARARVVERWSQEPFIDTHLALYESLIASQKGA